MSTQRSDYRNTKAISNSIMGVYEDDFDSFVKYWVRDIPFDDKKDEALTMGSIIDTLLTTPEEYDKRFIVFPGEAPTGQIQQFCAVVSRMKHESSEIDPEVIYNTAYNEVGFKRDTLAKVKEKFKLYKDYYNFLNNKRGKIVITSDQSIKARTIVHQLKNSKYTASLVNATETKDIKIFNQLELYSEWNYTANGETFKIPLKGALDRVLVDHKSKVVLPCDFKSSYSVLSFEQSYIKWRYYRQGSYYSFLLKEWMKENNISNYTLKPFIFIVCSTTGGRHYIYKMDTVDIKKAELGGFLKDGKSVKGWRQILNEIGWLTYTNNWDYPYEAAINNGVVPLNIFKDE